MLRSGTGPCKMQFLRLLLKQSNGIALQISNLAGAAFLSIKNRIGIRYRALSRKLNIQGKNKKLQK